MIDPSIYKTRRNHRTFQLVVMLLKALHRARLISGRTKEYVSNFYVYRDPWVIRTRSRKVLHRRLLIKLYGKCQWCGSTRRLEADHVYPRSRGGPEALTNKQLLCRKCNSLKADKIMPEKWENKPFADAFKKLGL